MPAAVELVVLVVLVLVPCGRAQDLGSPENFGALVAQIGHPEREVAAKACESILAAGERALPLLFAEWDRRVVPTRPRWMAGQPSSWSRPTALTAALRPDSALAELGAVAISPAAFSEPIAAASLPAPSPEATLAVLMDAAAPSSEAVRSRLHAGLETDRIDVAIACGRVLRFGQTPDLRALAGVAARGSWCAGALLVAFGTDGVAALRARKSRPTLWALSLTRDPGDDARVLSALRSRDTDIQALAAGVLARFGAGSWDAVSDALDRRTAVALAVATVCAHPGHEPFPWTELATLATSDDADERDLAVLAMARGARVRPMPGAVRTAFEQGWRRGLASEDRWPAWAAAMLVGGTGAVGWEEALGDASSENHHASQWAAAVAGLIGIYPPAGAFDRTEAEAAAIARQADALVERARQAGDTRGAATVRPEVDPTGGLGDAAAGLIWDALRSDDKVARCAACRALGALVPEWTCESVLLEWTAQGGGLFGIELGLSGGPTVDVATQFAALRAEDPRRRARAVSALVGVLDELDDEQREQLRVTAFGDDATEVRRALFESLLWESDHVPDDWIDGVVAALDDPDWQIRLAVVRVACRLESRLEPAGQAVLANCLVDPEPAVRAATLDGTVILTDARLMRALADPQAQVVVQACAAIRRVLGERSADWIARPLLEAILDAALRPARHDIAVSAVWTLAVVAELKPTAVRDLLDRRDVTIASLMARCERLGVGSTTGYTPRTRVRSLALWTHPCPIGWLIEQTATGVDSMLWSAPPVLGWGRQE